MRDMPACLRRPKKSNGRHGGDPGTWYYVVSPSPIQFLDKGRVTFRRSYHKEKKKTMLTVLTWNADNFFRPGRTATIVEHEQYKARLNFIGILVRQEAPDAVVLQEVGGMETLDDLKRACRDYPHLDLSSFPDDRGIRVAILSKAPLSHKKMIMTAFLEDLFSQDREVVLLHKGSVTKTLKRLKGKTVIT